MKKEQILKIRLDLHLTQAQMAALLGCTVASLSRWENGVATPSRLHLKELHRIWGEHGSKVDESRSDQDA